MRRVLVVDDEPDVRKTLGGELQDQGHDVCQAANEAEAYVAIAKQGFDFAVIDVRLHGGEENDESGLSLAMAMRLLRPGIRVILLTRYVRSKQIVRAVRYYGVLDFIDKSDPDYCQQIAELVQAPHATAVAEPTRLSLLLTPKQPLVIRSRGNHVCSTRSQKALRLNLQCYRRSVDDAMRHIASWRSNASKIGDSLWKNIFGEHKAAYRTYTDARAKTESLLLSFETSRDLLGLPLEFTRSDSPAEYLVLQHPVARFVCEAVPRRSAISPQMLGNTNELKVLILSSNTGTPGTASDIPAVDTEGQQVYSYLMSHQQTYIPVSAKHLPTDRAAWHIVEKELLEEHYDIVHYAGHGWFDSASPENSCLYFWSRENRQGNVEVVTATKLKLLLDRTKIRLVYLSCCYGAAVGDQSALLEDDFLGIADAVAQAGVPSVVGYRWPVSDERARELAQAFYESLLKEGSPEIALWRARCKLAADRDDPTWLAPMLIHQE